MKVVIQRVSRAQVETEEGIAGAIGAGFLVLLGVTHSDTRQQADKLAKKMLGLRIFPDAEGKTNLSLADVGGQLLVVSQFTLYADCRKGYRPSFTEAAGAQQAKELYEYFVEVCRRSCPVVETGVFGAHMEVSLVNDGPFTIVWEEKG
ncbi:MAG: D-tyrosyl-tRNA(Tyr) deacylase [Lachnospiraceae bacterium]|nr:D-tyrosyl-tRNA(Tyr) deacylase [Lachnospiraceae bacterium]